MRTATLVLVAAGLVVLTARGTFGPASNPAVWLLAGFLLAVALFVTGGSHTSREGN